MKPSEVIDTALTEYLPDESKWMQHDWYDEENHCCMLGALDLASGRADQMTAPQREGHEAYHQARVAVTNVITEISHFTSVASFNDAGDRTFDEVRSVLEKARAKLQEQGR